MIKSFFAVVAVAFVFLLTSCEDKTLVFEENKSMEGGVWNQQKPVKFEFEVRDTTTLHNFYINLRNGENYPYSNLNVFIELTFPNGKKSIDTVNCVLADPTGRWLGSGLGDIYDNRIRYMERKQFPMTGRYNMSIYQAMYDQDLPGIYDVGFRLARWK